MAVSILTVGPDEAADLTVDFTKHLADKSYTIASATVTCDVDGVAIVTTTPSSTLVTWRMVTTGLAWPQPIEVVVTPTYTNGDVDPRYIPIQITRKS